MHIDRNAGRESRQHYPMRLLKAIQARQQRKEGRKVKRGDRDRVRNRSKKDLSTAGEREGTEQQRAVQRKIHR